MQYGKDISLVQIETQNSFAKPTRLPAKYRLPYSSDVRVILNQHNVFSKSFKSRCQSDNSTSSEGLNENGPRRHLGGQPRTNVRDQPSFPSRITEGGALRNGSDINR